MTTIRALLFSIRVIMPDNEHTPTIPTANENQQIDSSVEQVIETVSSWPGIATGDGRFNSTTFQVGQRGVGHVHPHPWGLVDISYPQPLREQLLVEGHTERHHVIPERATTIFPARPWSRSWITVFPEKHDTPPGGIKTSVELIKDAYRPPYSQIEEGSPASGSDTLDAIRPIAERTDRPMTDDEHEQFREQMNAQRPEIREALAENLGGDPEDYLQRDE
jgi:transglutaminase-like putative cysteine protease